MSAKMLVKPKREGLPPHPVDGPLPKEGGLWTADQFTFRMLRDGDIVEVAEERANEKATRKSKGE